MEKLKCTYDEFYKLRNAIHFAENNEINIQVKRLNDANYKYSYNPIEHLLAYRKQVVNRYLNIQITEEEKNTLLELFKNINKQIVDILGLNF